ncbi:monooxygenase, partial [filamentous cyanobacterium CCP1]
MRQLLNSTTNLLIVGAGPTGLTMAHELLRRGIACRLIEQKDTLAQTSRAIGIHSRTLEIFEAMGVVEAFLSQGVQITGGNVYDGGKTLLRLDFQHLDAPYPYILSLPQSKTEQNLLARLRSLRGEVEFSRQLLALQQENDTVVAQVKHTHDDSVEKIQADWVIGCDGARSQVRESLNLTFEGSTYEEEFVQADVNLDWKKSRQEIHVWLHESGPFAVFPLPDGEQWRLIAGIVDSGRGAPEASVEVLQRIFQERTGDNQTTISNPTWLSNFKIHRRIVNHYRQGRIFLAGDAAHIHSPVGA